MIIDFRGTNGAGKSYVPHRILREHEHSELQLMRRENDGKPAYFQIVPSLNLMILGRYKTVCGGCDGINSQDTICELVRMGAREGRNVFLEGSIVSDTFSRWDSLARELEAQGHQYVFAFLDTPLQTCIDRVLARRAAKGNDKPFDPDKSLVPRFRRVAALPEKFKAAGRTTCSVNHHVAYDIVMSFLKGSNQS
jgi:hypothetical protein